MTGANFAVAETGTVVVCTNEGNADLSVNLPKLYIASIGIEKIVPRIEHLGVFVRMLSRSALGSPITQLTSHFRAPREGTEMHIVLVDNGRSERLGMADFWYSLKCIRCGACMNTCPVYRRSGGLSYGATYSGPIGVIIDPTFNLRKYSSLPFASTLNGSCTSVCPVKINIHEQIYKWRQIIAERHQLPFVKQEAMRVAGKILGSPKLYRAAVETAGAGLEHLPRFMMYSRLERLGTATRSSGGAAVHVPPVVSEEPEPSDEQPRRHPGAGPEEPAAAATAACGADLRCRDGLGARALQGGARPHGRQARRCTRRRRSGCARRGALSRTPRSSARRRPKSQATGRSTACEAPAELDDVDVGVVRAVFGVAETGSVWLTEAELKVNALGFLSQHLVVLLDPARIVGNLHTPTASAPQFDVGYGVFMTGPSATADIEGVLIHGAQGIRSLTVVPVPPGEA